MQDQGGKIQSGASLYAMIDSLHNAYGDSAKWDSFLSCLAGAVGARSAAMVSLAPVDRTGWLITHRLSHQAIEQWQLRYQGADPWLSAITLPGAGKTSVYRGADGYSLPVIAHARDCSLATVRSHLKNAKRKAGVNRQVELGRVMLALEGSLTQ